MIVLNEPQVQLSFREIDQGLLNTFPRCPLAFYTYLYLRRYVWRATFDTFGEFTYGKGLLVSRISKKKLAACVKVSPRQLCRILDSLEQAYWVAPASYKRKRYYILGVLTQQLSGKFAEDYFQESRIGSLEKPPIEVRLPRNLLKILPGVTYMSLLKVTPVTLSKIEYDAEHATTDGEDAPLVKNANYLNMKKKKESPYSPPTGDYPDKKTPQSRKGFLRHNQPLHRKEKDHPRKAPSTSPIPSDWAPSTSRGDKPAQDTSPRASKIAYIASKYQRWYQEAFGSSPTLTKRSTKHLKELVQWWGVKETLAVLKHTVMSWREIVLNLHTRQPVPTIETIYAYRDSIKFLTDSHNKGQSPGKLKESGNPKGW